jgi:Right handed beta helix region
MKLLRALPLLFAATALDAQAAVAGKTPIHNQTTITQSGSYIVTRNITATSGPVITILADGVELDLNGFTLTQLAPGDPVILMSGTACSGGKGCETKKGTTSGGSESIRDDAGPSRDMTVRQVRTSSSSSSAIRIGNAGKILIEDCDFVDPGGAAVDLTGPTGSLGRVDFVRNRFGDVARAHADIKLLRMFGILSGNVLPVPPAPGPSGPSGAIVVQASRGVLIEHNSIAGTLAPAATVDGIHIDAASVDVSVVDNVISGAPRNGVRIEGQGNWITDNLINRCAGPGVHVSGSTNVVDRNRIGHNTGNGIFFDNATGPHVYRANVLRGNTSAGVGGAPGNTDGGGNVL